MVSITIGDVNVSSDHPDAILEVAKSIAAVLNKNTLEGAECGDSMSVVMDQQGEEVVYIAKRAQA